MSPIMAQWWMGALVVLLAAMLGYYLRHKIGRYASKSAEQEAKRLLEDTKRDTDSIRQQADLQAKAAMLKARDEFEKVLNATGYTLEQIHEYVAGHKNLSRAMYHFPHAEGIIGTGANYIAHVSKLMREERWVN